MEKSYYDIMLDNNRKPKLFRYGAFEKLHAALSGPDQPFPVSQYLEYESAIADYRLHISAAGNQRIKDFLFVVGAVPVSRP